MSAIVVSSVSPERCDIIGAYEALLAISTASSVSVRVPIWFTFTKIEFATLRSIPFFKYWVFVTKRSSPTSWVEFPIASVIFFQPAQSSSAHGSSIENIGYFDLSPCRNAIMSDALFTELSDFLNT